MSETIKPYFTYGVSANDRDLVTSTTVYSGQHKRYFSSLDAEVFIGEERLLDIVRIDFSYEEKQMPYYGFNSFWPSRFFTGQKLIQGTFVINFTEPGYIAKLLQKIDVSELSDEYELMGKACNIENAPLFAKPFDILVGYGGYNIEKEASFRNTYQKLQGVRINGYQQILDTSGEPVLEVYSFLAKNLKFGGYEYESGNSGNDNDGDNNSNQDYQPNVTGVESVDKQIAHDVKELREKCTNHEKVLGIIVEAKHSLHVKDEDSHIYVNFELINSTPYNRLESKEIAFTVSDNKANLSKTYILKNKNGV
ncbi:hypothetical protein [Paraclostridium dentum]|uniref:hypothetical protein n=1 Tax=Paraclostridium dentum TaxID=2662455 RepID=UPI003F387B63